MNRFLAYCILFTVVLGSSGCKEKQGQFKESESKTDYRSISAINPDSTVNMIVEIPTGTVAKYEMNKTTYQLVIDSIDGKARYIDYLGYPGNYGMIPNTLLNKSDGGDGDPLDILVLGKTLPRGSVHAVKVIGVIRLLDNGEQDDKIIGVIPNSDWNQVDNINDLIIQYPGAKEIIELFFKNYKGKGQMVVKGWGDEEAARSIISKSIEN